MRGDHGKKVYCCQVDPHCSFFAPHKKRLKKHVFEPNSTAHRKRASTNTGIEPPTPRYKYVGLCLCVCMCVAVLKFVCMCTCLSVCLFVCMSVRMRLLSVYLSACKPVCLSVSICLCLSVSVFLYVCKSLSAYVSLSLSHLIYLALSYISPDVVYLGVDSIAQTNPCCWITFSQNTRNHPQMLM